ncbi:MAG: asparagine synthetase B, partial [Enterococcus casseliflavus]
VKSLFESDFAATFFDQTAILQMLEDHRQGKPNLQRKIWTIFTFLTWYKVFFIDESIPEAKEIVYETL